MRGPGCQTTAEAYSKDRDRIRRFAECSARRAIGRQVAGAAGRTRDARRRRGSPGSKLPWPSVGGIRSTIAREVRRINVEAAKAATKALNRAKAELERSGWRTRTQLRTGEPLRELMTAVGTADPQLLVIGARGTSAVRQLLLGSVAEGVLNRSPVPVLLAR